MNNSNDYPEFLYHYTSIDSLALILKNRTIRFNSLINVDDPEEIRTSDTEGIGKYCYCSCWTDLEESIPFWKMYTKNMHGVMIKLKTYPFEQHKQFLEYFDGGKTIETYVPKEIFEGNKLYTIPTIPFLRKIEYNDDIKPKVFDKVISTFDNRFNMTGNLNDVGKYKSKDWSFQSEWRYSMILLPHDELGRLNIDVSNEYKGCLQYYYDVKLRDDAFDDMEIVIGPNINNGEREIIKEICNKFAPKIKISDSRIKIK